MAEEQINMMMSVLPGTMTGFAALNAGLVSINNAFLSMTSAFGREFGLMDTIIATTGVVVTQFGLDAMNAFGQFEQGMKIVQMVSGQSKSDIEQLTQAANQFSIQYRTDIDQITEGLQTLGRAGLNSASEQSEVLQNGLNTAKLEGRDLNGVLEELIQNTALLGGNLKSNEFGEDSQYINDLLVATSMTAPITTHDVSETLKYSGGIAAAAGANIRTDSGEVNEEGKAILEDYMGAIAAFAQKGVTGSIAGTALRAFFNKPATQDSSVTDALASIKLKPEYLWEDDEETMKPVSEQIRIITDQMDKLDVSTMDRLQIWSKIVGGKMGQQMMKLESNDIKDLTKDIQAADDASSLAANSMKTYEANIKALGESGAALQRNVGRNLVFFANPVLQLLTKIAEFGNQDFMSLPISLSIIGFFAALVRRIRSAFNIVRSEFASLTSAFSAGQKFLMGKTGFVRNPDGSLSIQPISPQSSSSKNKTKAPTTLGNYAKQYMSQIQTTGNLTLEAFKKAGVSPDRIALAGHLSGLTSAKNTLGVPEGQIWAAALKHNLLTESQLDTLKQGFAAGLKPRQLANLIGIESVIPQIYQFGQAMSDLGVRAKTMAEAMNSTFGGKTSKSGNWQEKMKEDYRNWADKNNKAFMTTFGGKTSKSDNWQEQMAKQMGKTAGATKSLDAALQGFENTASRLSASLKNQSTKGTQPTVVNPLPVLDKSVAVSTAELGSRYPFENEDKFKEKWTAKDFWMFQRMRAENAPQEDSPKKDNEPTSPPPKLAPVYPKEGDPQAEYVNKLVNKAEEAEQKRIENEKLDQDKKQAGKYGDSVLSKEEQDAVAKKLGIGSYASEPDKPKTVILPGPRSGEENVNLGSGLEKELEIEKEKEAAIAADNAALAFQNLIAKLDAFTQHVNAIQNWNPTEEARKRTEANAALTKEEGKETAKRLGVSKTDGDLMEKRAREAANSSNKFQNYSSMANFNMNAFNEAVKDAENASKKYAQALSVAKTPSLSGGAILAQQGVSEADINKALGKYGVSSQYGYGIMQPLTMGTPADWQIYKEHQDMLARTPSVGRGGLVGDPEYVAKKTEEGFGSAFKKSFSDRINRDRTGSFLSFGKETGVGGATRSATKGLSGLANKALNLTDAFGGPLMIAIMAVTAVIQIWQQKFQEYCENLQKASDDLKNAYSKRDSAEDDLERSYREKNPDATDKEIEEMVLGTYQTMGEDMANAVNNGQKEWIKKINTKAAEMPTYEYDEEADDGTMKPVTEEIDSTVALDEAIKENTGALYEATAELSASMEKYVREGTDPWWGVDGWTGKVTDFFGGVEDSIAHAGNQGWGDEQEGNRFMSTRSKFTDENSFLLTARQKDENYSGNTEMAGLMLQNWKDYNGKDDYMPGLRTMMGVDADTLENIISKEAKSFLASEAKFASRLSQTNNLRLQQSMTRDAKTWKSLAKEMVKQERKTGKPATGKNMTKKIEGLIAKLNSSMGQGFSKTQIQQAAYLQVAQGMLEVAQTAIVPIISDNAITAAKSLGVDTQIYGETNSTSSSNSGIEGITSMIAGMVAQIAMAKAGEARYNQVLMKDPNKLSGGELYEYNLAKESKDASEFVKKSSQASYEPESSQFSLKPVKVQGGYTQYQIGLDYFSENDKKRAMDNILATFGASANMSVYGSDASYAVPNAQKAISEWRKNGASTQQIFESLAKIYQTPKFKKQLQDTYINSGDEEGEGSSGGGSGSGSGSGSGNKSDNSGTRKERVDLVLCNKKTIPKLNVNLFKKPPSFTILNKNFKLRDVKINSEDKPKAIMAAIKNGFIDIQKRTDPKIIQDEEAVYDPAAATDGTNVPSGSAKTRTTT